jgi:hypothetical protein
VTNSTDSTRATRASTLRWVSIADMKVSPKAQREYKESHAEGIAADFDLEAMGFPVVSHRDGNYYILDGQHRIAALKMIGYGDQSVQCEVYEGLTEAAEAELFLRRDRRKAVTAFDRFRIGVVADRPTETDINRIVMGSGLRIATDQDPKSIAAVGALLKTYRNAGGKTLGRSVRLLRDGFPDDSSAFRRELVEGAGLLCQRYNGDLNDDDLKAKLAALRGGANGLLTKAARIRLATGETMSQCTAAALVEVANAGRGGKKLPTWWKS